MSRLEAALHRATTGFVVEGPDPADDEPPAQPLDGEPVPAQERTLVRHEIPGPHHVAVVDEQAIESRFEALNPAHAEKLVTSETLPASLPSSSGATMLHHAQAANGMKLLMISSASSNEGKTLTATIALDPGVLPAACCSRRRSGVPARSWPEVPSVFDQRSVDVERRTA